MSPIILPPELLGGSIFRYLQYDRSSMHACLLVNRFWCQNMVPWLWTRPFELLKSREPSPELINTYISCLNEGERDVISKEAGIQPPITSSRSAFDYASFIRELHDERLRCSILQWLYGLYIRRFPTETHHSPCLDISRFESYRKIQIDHVTLLLGKILLGRCPTLNRLALDLDIYTSTITNFSRVYTNCLSQLCCFVLKNFKNIGEICDRLSYVCNNLHELELDQVIEGDAAKGVAQLIKAQNRLIKCKLRVEEQSAIKIIFSTLANRSRYLTSLYCTSVNIDHINPIDLSKILDNLETLGLAYCSLRQKISLSARRLKNLYFEDTTRITVTIEAAKSLIESTNGNLRRLSLGGATSILMSAIKKYCSNLVDLNVCVWGGQSTNFSDFLGFLVCCPRLEKLQINDTLRVPPPWNTSPWLIEMSRFLPTTLWSLEIPWEFTPEALRAFLEKCKAPIRELYLTNHINLVDAHLEYLTQYAIKKETLKKLGVSSYCSLTGEALQEASEVMMVTRYGVRLLSLVGRR